MAATETKFDDVMMAMDVVDTLRHEDNLVEAELSGDKRRQALVVKLREIYRTQGLELTDELLNKAVDEIEERRFVYEPLKPGTQRTLATMFVRRKRYAIRSAIGAAVLAVGIGGPVMIVNKIQADRAAAQVAAAKAIEKELNETLPRELSDAVKAARLAGEGLPGAEAKLASVTRLEQDAKAAIAAKDISKTRATIGMVTAVRTDLEKLGNERAKRVEAERLAVELVQQATSLSAEARDAAKTPDAKAAVEARIVDLERAAKDGNRGQFNTAKANLASLVEEIRLPLTVRIVDRKGINAGVWRMRNNDPRTKLYYLVVEAERPDGRAVERDIRNAETGRTDRVTTFALRVPEEVYDRVRKDKTSDGIINDRDVGTKPAGSLSIGWSVPTGGETITKW